MKPTAQGAYSLALWLRANAPALFMAIGHTADRAKLNGLGCDCHGSGSRRPQGLGQDFTVSVPTDTYTYPFIPPEAPISTEPYTYPFITPDSYGPSFSPAPVLDTLDASQLTPITVTQPMTLPTIDMTPPQATDSTPGFLSSVGSFLTTGGGLTAALGLAATAIQSSTARAVAQAQIARVAGGANPAAISYRVNPATGLVSPMLATPQGALPVSYPILSRLAPNSATLGVTTFLTQNWIWLAVAAVAGLVLIRR